MLVRVYTCQNAKSLEITCRGSNIVVYAPMSLRTHKDSSESSLSTR